MPSETDIKNDIEFGRHFSRFWPPKWSPKQFYGRLCAPPLALQVRILSHLGYKLAFLSTFRAFWPLLGASWAYLGRVLGLSWLLLGPIWTHLVAVFLSLLAAFVFPPFLSKICPERLPQAPTTSCHSKSGIAATNCRAQSEGRRWLPQRGFQLNKQ